VDPSDIFISKLSSKQEKHIQDLRVMAKRLDKEIVKQRLFGDGKAFVDDAYLRPQIEANWRFVFQESLFPESAQEAGGAARTPTPAPAEPGKSGLVGKGSGNGLARI
jgi:hypothetical protein